MSASWGAEPLVGAVEVGPAMRTVRALTAGSSAAAFVALAVTWDFRVAWVGVGLALLALGDALVSRRRPGRSPVLRLMLDAAVLMSVVVWVGGPALVAAPYAYLLASALMVLPMRRALLVISYLTALVVAAQFVSLPSSDGPLSGVLTLLGMLIPVAAMGTVLWVAGRAVRLRDRRQRAAAEEACWTDRQKSELLATVSHDVRSSLTSVSGFLATLTDSWRELPPVEVDEFLGIVSEEAEHLTRLAEDILTATKLEAGQLPINLEAVEVGPLVHYLAQVHLGGGADRRVAVVVDPATTVWADRLRLGQVLRNLFRNAGQYGGDAVTVSAAPDGDCLLLEVCDSGEGIPVEDRERIFGPFQRLDNRASGMAPGVGLGLSIARGLARAMGGDLWCEPGKTGGTRFCLTLRLDRPAPDSGEGAVAAEADDAEVAASTPGRPGSGRSAPASPALSGTGDRGGAVG